MTSRQNQDKPILEGLIAGGACLIVTVIWIYYNAFHPLIVFILYIIGIFCLLISTIWIISKGMSVMTWLLNNSVSFFLIGLIVTLLIVVFWDFYYLDDLKDVLVEFHGLVFDFLFLGVLLTIYEHLRDKKSNIERWKEELDDYRGWTENEASYRVFGLIKRLKKNGVSNLDYSNLHLGKSDQATILDALKTTRPASLEGANLKGNTFSNVDYMYLNLRNSNFESAIFTKSKVFSSEMSTAKFRGAIFEDCEFDEINFSKSSFGSSKFKNSRLINVYFIESGLGGSTFQNCDVLGDFSESYMREANLEGSRLSQCRFDSCVLKNAVLRETDLSFASFVGADLKSAYLKNANLFHANFRDSRLWGAELENAQVDSINWFEKLKNWNVIGAESLDGEYYVDKTIQKSIDEFGYEHDEFNYYLIKRRNKADRVYKDKFITLNAVDMLLRERGE